MRPRIIKFITIICITFLTIGITLSLQSYSEDSSEEIATTDESCLTPLKIFLGDLNALIVSLLIILMIFLLILAFVRLVVWAYHQNRGLVILPFAVFGDQNSLDGRAISDSLTLELQRILKIHKSFENKRPEASERSLLFLPIQTEKLEELSIKPETLEMNVSEIGTLEFGGLTISLGEIMVFLNHIFLFHYVLPKKEPGKVITGSLHKFGSLARLVAHMNDPQIYSWESSQIITDENQISEMICDMAFKISRDLFSRDLFSRDLSKESIEAKDWESFKYFTEAIDQFAQYKRSGKLKSLESARENCIKAFESEPDYSRLFGISCNLGIAYLDKADYTKAGEMFDYALQLKPDNSFAISGKASVSSRLGFHDEALDDINYTLNNSMFDEKRKAQIIAQRGNTYSQLGEIERLGLPSSESLKTDESALDDFKEALKNLTQDEQDIRAFVLSRRGALYSRLGQYDRALKDLDEAINIKPSYAWALASRGVTRLLMGEGNYKEVFDDLNLSLRLDSKLSWAYANRGEAYRQLEEYSKAITDFSKALSIDPNYSLGIAGRGLSYLLAGSHQKALDDFNSCLDKAQINPRLAWVFAKRGLTYAYLKDFDNALRDLNRAIDLNSQRDWFYYNRAQIYLAFNYFREGYQDLREAIGKSKRKWDENPQDWRNTYNLAIYQLIAKNILEAKSLYKYAIQQRAPHHFTRIAICDLKSFLMLFPQNLEAQKIKNWLDSAVPKINYSV